MGWAVSATPRPFNPRERLGTHCIGGLVGPRAGLDGCGKLVELYVYSFLHLVPRWVWAVNATPRSFYPRERHGTHRIGGWVDPRAGLDGCGKSHPPPGLDPRTVHPVASRYTELSRPGGF